MTTLRIGELANRAKINLETIRYYEREGLIQPPERTPAGHHAYSPQEELRLRFIKRAQALGFTLAEIKELLALRVDPKQSCKDVAHQILDKMKTSCDGRCSVSECLILEGLNSRRPS